MDNHEIVVVKVGSSTLSRRTARGRWRLDPAAFRRIASQIQELQRSGCGVVIVSSGAITAGLAAENMTEKPSQQSRMAELQALASIGNPFLASAWGKALSGQSVGSVLLTRHSLDENVTERNQAVRVVLALLGRGSIPVVNENDAIANEEIAYGDNDTLSATLSARLSQAGCRVRLVLLSDVDGVYSDRDDPKSCIPLITDVDNHMHIAGPSGSLVGTGGMLTKFAAATIALQAGAEMWIANGSTEGAILAALSGQSGTHFATSKP